MMNVIGSFVLIVAIGVVSTTFNRAFFIDKDWNNGDPCLIETPNGVIVADHCYGYSRK